MNSNNHGMLKDNKECDLAWRSLADLEINLILLTLIRKLIIYASLTIISKHFYLEKISINFLKETYLKTQ